MDNRRRAVIERYVQAVSFHGEKLLRLTREEQADDGAASLGFVFPNCKDANSASYFKNRLQVSCPSAQVDGHTSGNDNEMGANTDQETRCAEGRGHFEQRLHRFIASKADLLFEMQGKDQLQQSVDCEAAINQEVLKLYASPPPIEALMAVSVSARRAELFKILQIGSIVLGEVTSKRPFGIFVKVSALEFSKHRDLSGLHVEALCRSSDLGGCSREYLDPTDAFVVGDNVRGVVCGVSPEEERISLSFRTSRLPPEFGNLQLGVIDETGSTDAARDEHCDEDRSYEECLKSDVGFNNPRGVDTLIEELGIDEQAPCSLLRRSNRITYPDRDFAEPLRKKQSAKWSMETTAKGVEHFKAGNLDAADKYFEHALQIDSDNVEALVARGALAANRGQLVGAVRDFRQALTINRSHRNAHKYLTATLVEQGIQLENDGDLEDALGCFKEALGLDPGRATAREHLERVRKQIDEKNQKKAKDAAKKQGSASQFRHVRQLIQAERSLAKSKRTRKKKKKEKSQQKKKKKQVKSKSRRGRSRRSSTSEESPGASSGTGGERKEIHRRTSGSGRKSGPSPAEDQGARGASYGRGRAPSWRDSGGRTRTRSRSGESSSSRSDEHATKRHSNEPKRPRGGASSSPDSCSDSSSAASSDQAKSKYKRAVLHRSRPGKRARSSSGSSDDDRDDRTRARSRSLVSGEGRSTERKSLSRKSRKRSRSNDSSDGRASKRAQRRSRSTDSCDDWRGKRRRSRDK